MILFRIVLPARNIVPSCLILAFILLHAPVQAQTVMQIGEWQSHQQYKRGMRLADLGSKVLVSTETGIFEWDKETKKTRGLSKIDGYSQINSRTVGHNPERNVTMIAYQNGYMDAIVDGQIIAIPDFSNSKLTGSKEVNDFAFLDQFCYISTSQGILQYNTANQLFGDAYLNIAPGTCESLPILSTTFLGDTIYAATPVGIIKAGYKVGLLQDCRNWSYISNDSTISIAAFQGKVYSIFKRQAAGSKKYYTLESYQNGSWTQLAVDSYRMVSLSVSNQKLWATADSNLYLIDQTGSFSTVPELRNSNHVLQLSDGQYLMAKNTIPLLVLPSLSSGLEFYDVSSPNSNEINDISNWGSTMYFAHGGLTNQGAPTYNNDGFSILYPTYRSGFKSGSPTAPDFRDAMSIRIDTVTNHIWAATMTHGILELAPDLTVIAEHNKSNLPLQQNDDVFSALHFDAFNNLWACNYRNLFTLVLKTAQGTWHQFNLPNTNKNTFTKILTDFYGNVWLQSNSEGLVVYNTNGTPADPSDDSYKALSTNVGAGGLPSQLIRDIAIDRFGGVWCATDNGVALFSEPYYIFNSGDFDAQKPFINLGGTEFGNLLEGQVVTAIAIDGANRKWFGTRNGVYLTTPDGDNILSYFNTDNSPLPSNNITAMEINGATGEVFFATDRGMVSYRSTATKALDVHTDVLVYPNPIRPDYKGPIAIKGLVRDAEVKITDITGKVVYETKALGGQAIWDGFDFKGREANSGVYLVFSSSAFGEQTAVAKIFIVR